MLCKISKFLFNFSNKIPFNSPLFVNSCVKMSIDIGDMRTSYRNKREAFLEEDIPIKDPIAQFKLWFDQVRKNPNVIEPNAMCLATATKEGIPSARYVLLKGYGPEGFTFFTNYGSRKGKELDENPVAALTFYWDIFNRSVRVEGIVEKLDFIDADQYFHRRPKQSQIGACVSNQSQIIEGRHVLVEKELELSVKYRDSEVPRPPTWGGYLVKPHTIEFWQGQTDRLHDRIRFRKLKDGEEIGEFTHQGENGWVYERLAP